MMFALVVAVLVPSQNAIGGAASSIPVTVNTATRTAYGSLLDARNGAGNQYIGCNVSVTTGATPSMTCSATDANGVSQYCVANSNSAFADVAAAVSSTSSYIYFQWNVVGGIPQCTYVYVSNNSVYL